MSKDIQIERRIALEVLKLIYISTPGETNQMCFYRNGIFIREKYDSTIRQYIKEIASETFIPIRKTLRAYNLSISKQNMIIDFIKSFTNCSLDDFDSNPRIINCKNGLYYLDGFEGRNTETGELELKPFEYHNNNLKPRLEPYKSFIQIPINYDPKAENVEIDQIFEDIFGFDDVKLIYEMIGYFLLPTTKYSKAFMLYGPTGTGKTTVIKIITQLIGFENTSGIELQKLDDKFELENTRNKLVNIFDDLSSKPIMFVGNFKKLVTNEYLYGRIKHIQEQIRWLNKCKGLFACNELPQIKKYVTDAFYTRWVLIPCFKEMKDSPNGINPELREKTYSEEEMSGLLNAVIKAIRRLEERRGFPKKWQNIDFVKNYWNMDINPVAKFVNDCCELGEFHEVDYEQFYEHVNKFREEHNAKEINKTIMTKALQKLGDNIKKMDRGSKVDKNERFYFKGLQFKEEYELEHLEPDKMIKITNNFIN